MFEAPEATFCKILMVMSQSPKYEVFSRQSPEIEKTSLDISCAPISSERDDAEHEVAYSVIMPLGFDTLLTAPGGSHGE
jgi:hypothetical protein